jgi:uncharacterized protein involved in response to NO
MATATALPGALDRIVHERWRHEPFRIFFPLGVGLAWIGIGHWLLYALGVTDSYSCQVHGLVQIETFLMAFAAGFLYTALPRRTQSPPPSSIEVAATAALLIGVAALLVSGERTVAEIGYASLFALLLRFAGRRLAGVLGDRRPPAAFVLIPIGVLDGLFGSLLIAASPLLHAWPWSLRLGPLLVEQGVFLPLVVGVGSLILPLMYGFPPPSDLGSSPEETRKALAYAAVGFGLVATFLAEACGSTRAAPLARAVLVVAGLRIGAAWRSPRKPGLHRRLAWIAVWSMPTGLAAAAMFPDYRVAALHILFIAGFGLLAFAVGTHVTLGHLGLEEVGFGRPPAVVAVAVGFALALAARLAADASHTYFVHLGWAAACWIAGSAVWLAAFGPKLLRLRAGPASPRS